MAKVFSTRSKSNLSTVHPELVRIAEYCLANYGVDFTVIQGKRSYEEQKGNFLKGFSKTMKSKHLETPSRAFDFIPYPFSGNWEDPATIAQFTKIGQALKKSADKLGILARWGGDWNMNWIRDEKFWDGGHFELLTASEYDIAVKSK